MNDEKKRHSAEVDKCSEINKYLKNLENDETNKGKLQECLGVLLDMLNNETLGMVVHIINETRGISVISSGNTYVLKNVDFDFYGVNLKI